MFTVDLCVHSKTYIIWNQADLPMGYPRTVAMLQGAVAMLQGAVTMLPSAVAMLLTMVTAICGVDLICNVARLKTYDCN